MHVEDEAVIRHTGMRSPDNGDSGTSWSVAQSSGNPTLPSGRTGIRNTVPFSVFVT